ncbi:MAG TPA: DUF6519 domain-containing protein, partial [Bryobacteraceae bacterium]|nr:DUF6519 domain-containing protein [Bryobacteraceae bacterium]
MKGDFSRLRFNRTKNYTQVLQQQGRVALDSDANEQNAINEQIRGTELIDVVGPFGGPSGDAGFAVTVNGNSIQIGAGRYYVEGLLCENPAAVGYLAQPYLIDPTATDAKMLQDLQNGTASAIQVFLEVWQRLVTPLDDPCLLEPALGAADTTARLQTVWRVVASEVAASSAPGQSTPGGPVLTTVGDRATLARNVASLVTGRLPVTDLPTKPVIGPRPGGGTSPSPTPAPEPAPTPA